MWKGAKEDQDQRSKLQSSIKYKSRIEGSLNNVFIACHYISGSQNETLGVFWEQW